MSIQSRNMFDAAMAEGRGRDELDRQVWRDVSNVGAPPNYIRVVVLDVIHDPSQMTEAKMKWIESVHQISNIKLARVIPRNTIIGQRVLGPNVAESEPKMFFFPFLPSHLQMPAKPGEHVWAMFEDPVNKVSDLGWWLWRITEFHHADDVNHSHAPRNLDPTFQKGTSSRDLHDNTTSPIYEFRNGLGDETTDGERYTVPETVTVIGGERAYEDMLLISNASRLMRYESVPRYRKRPGELAFEGSNNTLIVLGDDRTGPSAEYEVDPDLADIQLFAEDAETLPKLPIGDVPGSSAGRIDLVVGRGQTENTSGNKVENTLGYVELAKGKSELTANEGDVDYANDRSRVLVSQRTMVDRNFGIEQFNTAEFELEDTGLSEVELNESTGDGCIVLKSDKVRIIARSDVEFLVTSYERDENGKMRVIEDTSKWAAIVIRGKEGDIIFKPAADGGIMKLGGDDADKGLVVSDLPATVDRRTGLVTGPTIVTTMGGAIITGVKGQAKFADKILVKS